MEIELAISFFLLLALTSLATVDMAFGQLSDVGLRRLAAEAEEHPNARYAPLLKEILENRARFSFTLSAAIQILLVVFSVLVTYISLRWFSANSLALFISLAAGLVLGGIFRQFIPRMISLRNPEGKLLRLLPVLRPFYRMLAFAAEPWHRSFDRLRQQEELLEANSDEEDEDNDDDIQALIDVGEAEGIIEEEERELIHSAFEFGDKTVEEVMTPRTAIVALPNTATAREACEVILETKHSRLPVFRDQIDNVEGLIYVRDLLRCWADNKADAPIAPFVRPVYFIPETKPLARLLEEMQKAHAYLAMVIDEYGGIAGLVTVEDILEEIVGEIEDEDKSGEDEKDIVPTGDGVYEVLGGTEIGKIERLFGMEIEADDFTTIAGLVIAHKGSVPRAGEQLSFRGLDVDVLAADGKRIERLRVKRAPETGEAATNR
ncbi:MAG: magnesium and cobalt exporter, family [Blastocatellia bacterium]|nr:magnesium and cobalt exporter, family [Blastocatellia bacterium]